MKQKLIHPDVDIQSILHSAPGCIYWKNLDSIYLGCNHNAALLVGFKTSSQVIGKTDYELPWGSVETAKKAIEDDKLVMSTLKSVITEDDLGIKNADGTNIIVRTEKTPLFDKNGHLVGILGVAVDITAEKYAERLKLESQLHQTEKRQQEEFKKIVNQVVHDIKSPISTLRMILPHCDVLPEDIRLTIKQSAGRVHDIAGNLLNRFKTHLNEEIITEHKRSSTLISVDILEIIAEKKYEYAQLSVDFVASISQPGYFVFININAREFKRMMSNLINNAVDAFDDKSGIVTIHLDIVDNKVQIIIKDNGKGMPASVKEKILNNIAVTSDKEDGHGIGFEQIRDTLAANEGN